MTLVSLDVVDEYVKEYRECGKQFLYENSDDGERDEKKERLRQIVRALFAEKETLGSYVVYRYRAEEIVQSVRRRCPFMERLAIGEHADWMHLIGEVCHQFFHCPAIFHFDRRALAHQCQRKGYEVNWKKESTFERILPQLALDLYQETVRMDPQMFEYVHRQSRDLVPLSAGTKGSLLGGFAGARYVNWMTPLEVCTCRLFPCLVRNRVALGMFAYSFLMGLLHEAPTDAVRVYRSVLQRDLLEDVGHLTLFAEATEDTLFDYFARNKQLPNVHFFFVFYCTYVHSKKKGLLGRAEKKFLLLFYVNEVLSVLLREGDYPIRHSDRWKINY